MVTRDLQARYKGSLLGIVWSFLNPLLMLAIYTFVFKYVFSARWPQGNDTHIDYAIILFAGLILHTWLADVMNQSVLLIPQHASFVKKIQFPLDILSWVTVISAGIQFLMGCLVFVAFLLVLGLPLHPEMLLLPIVMLPYAFMLVGFSWILAALGVFLKDLGQLMGSLVTMLMFTSTVFFSLENAPELIRPLLLLNPLTIPVNSIREVMLFGQYPDWHQLGAYTLVAFSVMIFGYALFHKLKKLFADVL